MGLRSKQKKAAESSEPPTRLADQQVEARGSILPDGLPDSFAPAAGIITGNYLLISESHDPLEDSNDRLTEIERCLRETIGATFGGEPAVMHLSKFDTHIRDKHGSTVRLYRIGDAKKGFVVTVRRFKRFLEPEAQSVYIKTVKSVLTGNHVHLVGWSNTQNKLVLKRMGSLYYLTPAGIALALESESPVDYTAGKVCQELINGKRLPSTTY